MMYKNIVFLLFSCLAIYSGYALCQSAMSPNTHIIEHQYIADFSDKKNLVGASTHVFVGTFIEKKGNIMLGGLPATIFSVKIIDNLKGNLQGTIDVIQEGGCVDNECYVSEGDIIMQTGTESIVSNSLLGKTYILSVRGNDKEGYILISHPAGKWELPRNIGIKDLKKLDIYKEFKKAYTEEVIPDADKKNNKMQNAYSELQELIISETKD